MRIRPLIDIAWALATASSGCSRCDRLERRCADLERRLKEAEQLAESRRLLLSVFDKNARRIERAN